MINLISMITIKKLTNDKSIFSGIKENLCNLRNHLNQRSKLRVDYGLLRKS